jgi:hypothetical protein
MSASSSSLMVTLSTILLGYYSPDHVHSAIDLPCYDVGTAYHKNGATLVQGRRDDAKDPGLITAMTGLMLGRLGRGGRVAMVPFLDAAERGLAGLGGVDALYQLKVSPVRSAPTLAPASVSAPFTPRMRSPRSHTRLVSGGSLSSMRISLSPGYVKWSS